MPNPEFDKAVRDVQSAARWVKFWAAVVIVFASITIVALVISLL